MTKPRVTGPSPIPQRSPADHARAPSSPRAQVLLKPRDVAAPDSGPPSSPPLCANRSPKRESPSPSCASRSPKCESLSPAFTWTDAPPPWAGASLSPSPAGGYAWLDDDYAAVAVRSPSAAYAEWSFAAAWLPAPSPARPRSVTRSTSGSGSPELAALRASHSPTPAPVGLAWDRADILGTAAAEARLVRGLRSLVRALTRDARVTVRPGVDWRFDVARNEFRYVPHELWLYGTDQLLGLACRAVGQKLFGAELRRDAVANDAFYLLLGALDGLRSDRLLAFTYPGAPGFLQAAYASFNAPVRRAAPGESSAAYAFVEALVLALGGGVPEALHAACPRVRAALQQAMPAVERAVEPPPALCAHVDQLARADVYAAGLQCREVVTREIWPVFAALLAHDGAPPQEGPGKRARDDGEAAGDARASKRPRGEGDPATHAGASARTQAPDAGGTSGVGRGQGDASAGVQGPAAEGESDEDSLFGGASPLSWTSAAAGDGGAESLFGPSPASSRAPSPSAGGATQAGAVPPSSSLALPALRAPPLPPEDVLAGGPAGGGRRNQLAELFARAAAHLESYADQLVGASALAAVPAAGSGEPDFDALLAELDTTLQQPSPGGEVDGESDDALELDAYADELARAEQQSASLVASAASLPYAQACTRLAPVVDALYQAIDNALQREQLMEKVGYYSSGRYDLRRGTQARLQQQATGRRDPKVFVRKAEPQHASAAVVLCVDISDSMRGARIDKARDAFVVLQEALERLQVPFGAVAYNQGAYLLAEIADTDAAHREQSFGLLLSNLGGGTCETPALQLAQKMLADVDVDRRLIFVLTDGEADARTPATVQELERGEDAIEVTGIGIGEGCAHVARIYGRHVAVNALEQLPERLGEALKDSLVAGGC